MKRQTLIVIAIAAALFSVRSSSAQNYKVHVDADCTSTNKGGLVHQDYDNKDIIQHCAQQSGITNLSGLTLVYNHTADALQVLSGGSNVVCTPLAFSGGVTLSKTNGTTRERLTFVFADGSAVANGTLAATEHYSFGSSNQVTQFSFTGSLQWAVPGAGTNSPMIYTGNINAGPDSDNGHHGHDDGDHHGHDDGDHHDR